MASRKVGETGCPGPDVVDEDRTSTPRVTASAGASTNLYPAPRRRSPALGDRSDGTAGVARAADRADRRSPRPILVADGRLAEALEVLASIEDLVEDAPVHTGS